MGRYRYPLRPTQPLKNVGITGVKTPLKPDRGWRIVAGPPLTPKQLHCATIPDGPDGWEGGEYQRLEAKETAAIKAAEIDASTDPDGRPVSSPDGVRCFVREEASEPQPTRPALPDDLSIPPFIDRRLAPEPGRLAA